MLKNKKGFMLVEVIITSTVIITAMVILYTSFSTLFTKYESKTNYHNIDALYATKEMMDYLMKNDFSNFLNTNLYNHESIYLIKYDDATNDTVCTVSGDKSFCEALKDLYGIETMVFTSYDKKNLENLKTGLPQTDASSGVTTVAVEQVRNQTMKEYIDYVIGYYNITDSNITEEKNQYDYVLLTETREDETYYYASLPIR